MARIRSIKPEFWSDRKISRLSRDARLLYLSMWNFSDEHGRLQGDPRYIKGHCLPYEDDLSLADVEGLLNELEGADRIQIYEVDGDPYVYLPNLARHQRLEANKQESRLPEPPPKGPRTSKNTLNPEPRADLSAQNPEKSAPPADSSGEIVVQQVAGGRLQVASGREQVAGVPTTSGGLAAAPATTQALVADWLDHCQQRPPGAVIGQVSKQIKNMVEEGIDPASIRAGIAAWVGKGLHPSALPSVVNEVMNTRPVGPKRSTADQRWAEGQALKAHFEALEFGA
ncbi:MAG: hypothetical protein ACXVGB_09705 [Mycobacteriaceae bacterium]